MHIFPEACKFQSKISETIKADTKDPYACKTHAEELWKLENFYKNLWCM